MRADKITNAILTLIVSLIVLISGCLSPAAGVDVALIERITEEVAEAEVHDEKLSSDNDVVYEVAADGNVWRSMYSLSRTEQVMRSGRVENRTYFISIFAVLFKIAVIPSIIMLITRVVWKNSSDVLGRMMRFLHDSDGKKNKWISVFL